MKKGTLVFIIRKIINYEILKKWKNVRIKRTSESCQVNMKMSQILPNISTDFHGAFAFLNVYQKTVVSTDE